MYFNESYQLIGLKGLGSADSLDSIGVIVFDTTCDVSNPTGEKLSDATTTVTPVLIPEKEIEEVKLVVAPSQVTVV